MSADTTQAAIERALSDGPGYGEQLLAEGRTIVVLDGEVIVRCSPNGTREVLGSIDHP